MSQLTLSAILKIVDQATRPLKAVQQQTGQSSETISRLDDSIDRLNRTLSGNNTQRYNNSLRQTQQQTSAARLATQLLVGEYHDVSRILTTIINKSQQWSASLARGRAAMRQDAKSMALGMAGLGYAVSIPVKAFAEAEDAAMMLKVSMMDSSGQVASEFTQINALATKLGARLPGSNADFQLMMANLVQQGISFKSILGGTGEAAGNLAVLLKMPFDEAAVFAAKMQDATQTAEKDMLSLMDTIQRTAYLGVDPTNMLGGFAKLGAGMKTIKQAGLEGANAMAPLLVMADQSGMTDLSSAGNALSKTFKAMLDQDKIDAALKGTKLKLNFSNGKGEFGGLDKMFKQLDKLKGMTTQQRLPIISDIFGNDAENMQILNLLIDKNKQGYDQTLEKMQRQADLQTRINTQLGTLRNLWEQTKGAATNAMVSIVEVLSPDIKSFVVYVSEVAEKITVWAKANPELIKTIASIALKLLVLKVAMMSISYTSSLVFGGIFTLIGGMTKLGLALWVVRLIATKFGLSVPSRLSIMTRLTLLLSRAFIFLSRRAIPLVLMGLRALAISLLTNPLTLVLTLIAVVALAIYRYWTPIKAFFSGFWTGLKKGLAPLGDTISRVFSSLKTTLAPLKPLWDGIVAVWRIFKGVVAEMLTPFQATNQELQNATSYGQSMGMVLGAVIGVIGEGFIRLGTGIGEFAGWLVMLPERVTAAFNSLKASVIDAGNTFLNYLLAPIKKVINSVGTLIAQLNRIPGINIKLPKMPTPATGSGMTTTPGATKPTTPVQAQIGN
jgi:TP901 family phage tail tape measure protein